MLGHAALRASNQRTASIFTPAKTSWALVCLSRSRWDGSPKPLKEKACPSEDVSVSFLKADKLFLDSPKAWEKERKLTSKTKETRRAGRVDLISTSAKKFSKWSSAEPGTSLVVQWIRIHLPTWGTWVHYLVREDPVGHGATEPRCHNCWPEL